MGFTAFVRRRPELLCRPQPPGQSSPRPRRARASPPSLPARAELGAGIGPEAPTAADPGPPISPAADPEPRAPGGLHTLRVPCLTAPGAGSAAPPHLHPPRLLSFPSARKCHWLQTISDRLPAVEGDRIFRSLESKLAQATRIRAETHLPGLERVQPKERG